MSAATTNQPPAQPPDPGQPSRSAHLLDLVRKLIDYAKELAATFHQHAVTGRVIGYAANFGTADIALIIAHITGGLLRAQALEARLIRIAGRLDAEPRPRGTSSPRTPRAPGAAPAAPPPSEHPNLVNLPTPEWIAGEIRRRPIGAVIADICRDLGIQWRHPLWLELECAIIENGGSVATLDKIILRRLSPMDRPTTSSEAWPLVRTPPPGWRSPRPP